MANKHSKWLRSRRGDRHENEMIEVADAIDKMSKWIRLANHHTTCDYAMDRAALNDGYTVFKCTCGLLEILAEMEDNNNE